MKTLVVEGLQWGDEGKGKITDYLAINSDVVVRFQGGNNAGHTINFDGNKYALSLLPSGVFNKTTTNVLANGMVINPDALIKEMDYMHSYGFEFNLVISNRAQVTLPYHMDLDGAYETLKGGKLIGTTKKGIGPTYSDKINRIGIRMGDLLNPKYLYETISDTLKIKNRELDLFGLKNYTVDEIYEKCMYYKSKIGHLIADTSIVINDAIAADKKILFEGAQGAMLCLDNGTYPYVTSSSPLAASVPVNAGVAPRYITEVLGIIKAYNTRVGEGPFPTEIEGSLGDEIRERGHEYGTVTGRSRRIGYFDGVVLKHAIRLSGVTKLSLMLFDVLSTVKELKICYAYDLDGKEIDYIPANLEEFARCKPLYKVLAGFDDDITAVKSYDELPVNAKKYIECLEEIGGVSINLVSVGPDRTQTIVKKDLEW